jgi:predicted nucleic acid-binding protein
MHQGMVVPLDATLALKAARISHDLKLPLADSVILATAQTYQAIIWTQDTHFRGLAGVRYTETK